MTLRNAIVCQFRNPNGLLGNIAGWTMARRKSNIERSLWTVANLKISPGNTVLEIGCGPGVALCEAAKQIGHGYLTGLDHSQTMIKQATSRIQKQYQEKNIDLIKGTVQDLNKHHRIFDKIYSVNVVQFWGNQETEFKHIFSLLSAGGISATTYMPRTGNATRSDAFEMADKVRTHMKNVGFKDIEIKELATKPVSTVCILGQKPL